MNNEHGHGHVHGPECMKPKTAIQEAMLMLSVMGESVKRDLEGLKWYHWRRRAFDKGAVFVIVSVIEMLMQLDAKYNNDSGDFN